MVGKTLNYSGGGMLLGAKDGQYKFVKDGQCNFVEDVLMLSSGGVAACPECARSKGYAILVCDGRASLFNSICSDAPSGGGAAYAECAGSKGWAIQVCKGAGRLSECVLLEHAGVEGEWGSQQMHRRVQGRGGDKASPGVDVTLGCA
eukprot:1140552-Pelagomonas_calceolata.AAC.1